MNVTETQYKKLLGKYTTTILNQMRILARCLELRSKDKLTIEENILTRAGLSALEIVSERRDEILDIMRFDLHIFKGDHIKFPPFDTLDFSSKDSIDKKNLKNFMLALDKLIEKRDPQKIKFTFKGAKILVQRPPKRPIAIGKCATYQEGLLRALIDPSTGRAGIIRTSDTAFQIINESRKIPKLETIYEKKKFIKNTFGEIQSNLREIHLGGLITIKWLDNDKNLQIKIK
jgi:hypothetical protein